MEIIKKSKSRLNGKKIFKLYLFGVLFYCEERTYSEKTISICGFSLCFHLDKFNRNEKLVEPICNFLDYFNSASNVKDKDTVLWVDQSLGGGTEVYSQNQFVIMYDNFSILRVQYDHNYDCYILSIPNDIASYVCSEEEFFYTLKGMSFSEICVNSLVGWKNPSEILRFVSDYKKTTHTKVSFRCHDYHALCPSFNLLNCDRKYCNLKYRDGCGDCIKSVKLSDNEFHNSVLFSGFKKFPDWRNLWSSFFRDTVDEVIAFSESSKDLFIRVYPELFVKFKVIPHNVTLMEKAIIKKHSGINIAFLGNMNLYQKGNLIIKKMIESNNDPLVRFFIIGSFDGEYNNLIVTGSYKSQDIPNLLSKYDIDIVFIPSVWPETFSYTTSEAISTGVPVACYNLGAPAERVSGYEKGLVLKEISPQKNLFDIIKFVKKIRNL